MKDLWSVNTAQDLPVPHSLLQRCSALFWFVYMLGSLEQGPRDERGRGALAGAVGREIAVWEGRLWVGEGWRELGGGRALPSMEETRELLCLLPLLVSLLSQQKCLGLLVCSIKVVLWHFISRPCSVSPVS